MIRILIVEHQPALQKGLNMRLSAEADFSVIGEASDCTTALDLAKSLRPDVILIDIEIPGMDGIAVTKTLHLCSPFTSIIILSMQDDVATRARGVDAGAAAFVAKSLPADTLLTTIRQVNLFTRGGDL